MVDPLSYNQHLKEMTPSLQWDRILGIDKNVSRKAASAAYAAKRSEAESIDDGGDRLYTLRMCWDLYKAHREDSKSPTSSRSTSSNSRHSTTASSPFSDSTPPGSGAVPTRGRYRTPDEMVRDHIAERSHELWTHKSDFPDVYNLKHEDAWIANILGVPRSGNVGDAFETYKKLVRKFGADGVPQGVISEGWQTIGKAWACFMLEQKKLGRRLREEEAGTRRKNNKWVRSNEMVGKGDRPREHEVNYVENNPYDPRHTGAFGDEWEKDWEEKGDENRTDTSFW